MSDLVTKLQLPASEDSLTSNREEVIPWELTEQGKDPLLLGPKEFMNFIYRKLNPRDFNSARSYFGTFLFDDGWYMKHKGKFVAISPTQPFEMIIGESQDEVLRAGYTTWKHRPFYSSSINRRTPRQTMRILSYLK